jgi:hypothetical protein
VIFDTNGESYYVKFQSFMTRKDSITTVVQAFGIFPCMLVKATFDILVSFKRVRERERERERERDDSCQIPVNS